MLTVVIGSSHSLDLGPWPGLISRPVRASIVLASCRARRLRRLLPCTGSSRYAAAAPIAAPPMRVSRFTIGRWRGRGGGFPGKPRGRIRKSHRTWSLIHMPRCRTPLPPSPGRCTTRVRIPSKSSGLSVRTSFPSAPPSKPKWGSGLPDRTGVQVGKPGRLDRGQGGHRHEVLGAESGVGGRVGPGR